MCSAHRVQSGIDYFSETYSQVNISGWIFCVTDASFGAAGEINIE